MELSEFQRDRLEPIDDDELTLLLARLPESEEEIYRRFIPTIANYAYTWAVSIGALNEADSLFQEASIGFLEGVRTYDPRRGASFRTWCYTLMRRSLSDYCRNRLNLVRVPSYKYNQEELDEVKNARNFAPLDAVMNHPGEVPDVAKLDRKALLERAKSRLTSKERYVVERWSNDMTLEQIGRELGVSTARVGRILDTARAKMRRYLTSRPEYIEALTAAS